jgi:hypothetical protein
MKVNLLELGQAVGGKITSISYRVQPGDVYIRKTKMASRPFKTVVAGKLGTEGNVLYWRTWDEALNEAERRAGEYSAVIDEVYEEEQE